MKILWLDDDRAMIDPYVRFLSKAGWVVDVCRSAAEAERVLGASAQEPYDLLILDVMIPVSTEDEIAYPPYTTNYGIETGLVFLQRVKHLVLALGTAVLVLTVRLDQDIEERFARERIPGLYFATKFTVRSPADLQIAATTTIQNRNAHPDVPVQIGTMNIVAADQIIGIKLSQSGSKPLIEGDPQELAAFLHDACGTALKLLGEVRLQSSAWKEADQALGSLREEVRKENPNPGKAAAALASVKRILEGAAGGALGGELLKRFIDVLVR